MNVACDYEAPMQMLTTEKCIATGGGPNLTFVHQFGLCTEKIILIILKLFRGVQPDLF